MGLNTDLERPLLAKDKKLPLLQKGYKIYIHK